ncbi:DUF3138 family protein [Caldimonas brevitalea]|uniref:Porin n=1 Tax=Caldimonas brevitalea TaxID=413882 RepID=A0A0G3BJV6_9BURK|nr:DUF3138 family protein [Caldimonas brevitalea]AKJ29682.1 hypothetical protein AAW51_2991 [Caldimonas brevitalea]
MMYTWKHPALAAALVAGLAAPAAAQSNAALLKELKALRERVDQLERKLRDQESRTGSAPAAAAPAAPMVVAPAAPPTTAPDTPSGMTAEQQQEFNRVVVKTEALEDAREASGFKGLKISGYMDPTYIYNHLQDRAGFQFLNRVDDDGYNYDNSYFGAAVLDLQKETDSNTRWRLTLAPNRGVGAVFDGTSIVHEASVSVPLGNLQTRFIAGQLPDWSGYEYLQPTLNKLITHNLLFDFTLPTAYTGAGMEITRGKWITKWMVANMNASKRSSGNKSPVLAYRVDYSRGEFKGFGFAGVHGKAANFSENVVDDQGEVVPQRDSVLHLFEFDAYFIRGDWTVQGQASIGTQRRAAITPDPDTGALRNAHWWGLSGLAAYKITPRFETIARLDYLHNKRHGGGLLGYTAADDRNGIGPAPDGDPERGANRYALSLGASYLFNLNTTLKAEYRLDRANLPVFLDVDDGGYKKTNHLLGASVLVSF